MDYKLNSCCKVMYTFYSDPSQWKDHGGILIINIFKLQIQTSSSCHPYQPYPQCSYASHQHHAVLYPVNESEIFSSCNLAFLDLIILNLVICCTHLLFDLLLDLFQVGSQVHGNLVLGSQQSLKHSVSRHAHFLQRRLLELALQVDNLDV